EHAKERRLPAARFQRSLTLQSFLFKRSERPDMTKSASDHLLDDPDRGKGSQEPDERGQSGNNSMKDQLGHRNPDPMQDGADSDFPEPGHSPEHSFEGELKKTV